MCSPSLGLNTHEFFNFHCVREGCVRRKKLDSAFVIHLRFQQAVQLCIFLLVSLKMYYVVFTIYTNILFKKFDARQSGAGISFDFTYALIEFLLKQPETLGKYCRTHALMEKSLSWHQQDSGTSGGRPS